MSRRDMMNDRRRFVTARGRQPCQPLGNDLLDRLPVIDLEPFVAWDFQ